MTKKHRKQRMKRLKRLKALIKNWGNVPRYHRLTSHGFEQVTTPYDDDYFDDDPFFDDYHEPETCPECGGSGEIINCLDDMCHGQDYCVHGDTSMCPECHGTGEV